MASRSLAGSWQRAASRANPLRRRPSPASAALASPPPLADIARSSWLRFLERLHSQGYFSGGEGAAAEQPAAGEVAASATGLVRRFGSAGDHKRAVLAFARAREGALLQLPQQPLHALVQTPLPAPVLDSIFGGRKAVNAVKRLRATLGVAASGACAAERTPHAAQGDAGVSDAARLALIWNTTVLPDGGCPPADALAAVLRALAELPAGAAVRRPPLAARPGDSSVARLTEAAKAGAWPVRSAQRPRDEGRGAAAAGWQPRRAVAGGAGSPWLGGIDSRISEESSAGFLRKREERRAHPAARREPGPEGGSSPSPRSQSTRTYSSRNRGAGGPRTLPDL